MENQHESGSGCPSHDLFAFAGVTNLAYIVIFLRNGGERLRAIWLTMRTLNIELREAKEWVDSVKLVQGPLPELLPEWPPVEREAPAMVASHWPPTEEANQKAADMEREAARLVAHAQRLRDQAIRVARFLSPHNPVDTEFFGPCHCADCEPRQNVTSPSDAAAGSLLVWTPHPNEPRVILGKSRLAPETTLYVIELMDGRDDRGKMRGAFMSDTLEREGLYDKALVNWLKWDAESQMREFLKIHTANE